MLKFLRFFYKTFLFLVKIFPLLNPSDKKYSKTVLDTNHLKLLYAQTSIEKPCLVPLCFKYSASYRSYWSLAYFSRRYFYFLSKSSIWFVCFKSLTMLVFVCWKLSSNMPLILLSYWVCWVYILSSNLSCSALCLFSSICWSSHYFCLFLKNYLLASYSRINYKIT